MRVRKTLTAAPEDQVLLLAARASPGEEEEQQRLERLLASPLRWEYILRESRGHGVAPLLHHHLRQQALLERLPPAARVPLERLAHSTAFRNLKGVGELRAFLLAADKASLPVIVLKGVALGELAYGDRGLRPMVDLDVLAPLEQMSLAETVLAELGYALTFPPAQFRQIWERQHAHLIFSRPGAAFPLELHWTLVAPSLGMPFRWDAEEVWDRSRRGRVAGAPAQVMAWEDLLLYLSLHHFKHSAQSLLGFCDLAEAVRRATGMLSWQVLQQRAEMSGTACIVGYMLWWVRQHLGAPVPEEVVASLCPRAAALERRQRASGSPVARAALIGNRWDAMFWQLPFLPGPGRRCRHLWRSLFPPRELVAPLAGHSPWRRLAFLLAPSRLCRAGSHLWRMGAGRRSP